MTRKILFITGILCVLLLFPRDARPLFFDPPDHDPEIQNMKAEIITIGDEILIGQIIDTNSAWLAERLNLHGVEVHQITSVHDDADHIKDALKKAEEKAGLIILTGGLGPTVDDITKEVLCSYFNTSLVLHEPTLKNIKVLAERRGMDMNRFNHDQALVPASCLVLPNISGTAPGLWFEKDGVIFVSLPGVPFEMKNIMENEVFPRLRNRGRIQVIFHKTVLTQGLPESALSERLEKWESALPGNIKIAYLPGPLAVRIRLSALGNDIDVLKKLVSDEIDKLEQLIPGNIFGYDHDTMAGVTGGMLAAAGKTLAVAEGATGGYISYLLSSDPGSRDFFRGGITVCPGSPNENPPGTGTVVLSGSATEGETMAREMALRIKEIAGSDYGVATSVVTAGGEKEKGIVWIAVAGPDGITTEKFRTGGNNERDVIRLSQTALQVLRRMILND